MGSYGLINNRMGGLAILPVLFFFCGCGLFKNVLRKTSIERTVQDRKLELTFKKDAVLTTKQESKRWMVDSGKYSYLLELWPRGKFVFSPELGFQGEAERMRITGTHQAASKETTVDQVERQTELTTQTSAKLNDRADNQLKTKNVESVVSWKIILSILVISIILTLWYLAKKSSKPIYYN